MYSDEGNVGNVGPTDVIALLAVFQKSRIAAAADKPRLLVFAKAYTLNKLLTRSPFHLFDEHIIFDLRRYINQLAEVFRSFKDNDKLITIEHVIRGVWYKQGINKLSETLDRAGHNRSSDLEVDWWDAKITLKHCQYMLLSMTDSYSMREHVVERGGLIIKGALLGHGNQFVEAKAALDKVLERQRKEEPWHREYMELEETYFEGFSHTTEDLTQQAEKEAATVVVLRDKLERVLVRNATKHSSTVKRGVGKVFRKFGQHLQAMGPYEEHDYYFEYLIIDLMYKSSFILKSRDACFVEIIGGIQSVLRCSHEAAHILHRKATDLYLRIDKLSKEDGFEYIKADARRFIDLWMKGLSEKGYLNGKTNLKIESDFYSRSRMMSEEISKLNEMKAELTDQITGNLPEDSILANRRF